VFRSHIDGSLLELTPEKAVQIQENLGSDIAMCLDECPPGDADAGLFERAVERTISGPGAAVTRIAGPIRHCSPSCRGAPTSSCGAAVPSAAGHDFPGYALGGFSASEPTSRC